MLVCILDDLLGIAINLFGFPGYLFAETFGLLIFAALLSVVIYLHFKFGNDRFDFGKL